MKWQNLGLLIVATLAAFAVYAIFIAGKDTFRSTTLRGPERGGAGNAAVAPVISRADCARAEAEMRKKLGTLAIAAGAKDEEIKRQLMTSVRELAAHGPTQTQLSCLHGDIHREQADDRP